MNRPEKLNTTDDAMHAELARVWRDVDDDPDVRVAVITGAGRAFSAGGDLDLIDRQVGDFAIVVEQMRQAEAIVRGIVDCSKPIVSAINGTALGAGLAVGLLADISVIAEDARIGDGHLRLGLAAGDHAVLLWPLLCGLAKSRYYLLTAELLDGREAERIGLVSRSVPADEVVPTALDIAGRLASGPQSAISWTKKALNGWLRSAWPTFQSSLAAEMLGFFGPDVAEGVRAVRERRSPRFPSATEQASSPSGSDAPQS
jgi:enoyl-CoA hydratase